MSHVSIVTGASRIGKAIAEILLQSAPTTKIVVIARTEPPLKALEEKYGSDRVGVVTGDITDALVSKKAVDLAVSKFGQLNSIIANAGVLEPVGTIDSTSVDDWKRLYDINLFSIVELIKQSLPHLKKTTGRVIAVSSGAATKAYSGWYAYGSSKAALNHLILSLATDEKDIRAISIAPGVVDTEMQNDIRGKHGKNMSPEGLQRFIDLHKNKQLVAPEEPGTVYAKLALNGWSDDLNGKFLRYNDEVLKDYQL
ncbi:Oxidoreductase, putative [Candida maltosa Xu316]|uniref:Oxidoreductase, putative n=1 Tax=Candida maltosa (strain Xu316) TaxID=1245528 RepID=M3JVJ0_CANMX|nr:Oxidoreductase, putative [Candida maltosa Xu316]